MVRTPFGTRVYRRFPGARPTSVCTSYLNRTSCNAQYPTCRWISDITGAQYCRGYPGQISHLVPPGASAVLRVPGRRLSSCQGLAERECKDSRCEWIEDVTGKRYCRGYPASAIPFSESILRPRMARLASQYVERAFPREESDGWWRSEEGPEYDGGRNEPHPRKVALGGPAFSGSGRFYPRMYTHEEKESWYPKGRMTEEQKKYCRCILYQMARDLYTYNRWRYNPYAICNYTLPAARLRGMPEEQLRSVNALTSRYGLCTRNLDFQRLPMELTYAWLAYHMQHGSARGPLRQMLKQQGRAFPTVTDFLQTVRHFFRRPEQLQQHYQWLVDMAKAIQQKEMGRPKPRRLRSEIRELRQQHPRALKALPGED